MNEQDIQDIFTVLGEFKDALNLLAQRQDQVESNYQNLSADINEVRSIMFDSIINPAKSALDGAARQDRYDDFMSANGDKFAKFGDSLKAIEGDDFDLANQAFEEYDSIDGEKPDAAAFGDEVVSLVEEQLNAIRGAIGAPADADIDVHQDGETGEVEVEVDGEEVPVEETAEETPEETETETKDGSAEPSPDEMADLMAELEKDYKD